HLPEYGVLFHRVVREKRPVDGEILLGVCAKGIIVYEKRKFMIECRGNKKKYTFVAERSKVAKYLCNLCSAQHKFNNEMSSRQLSHSLVSDDTNVSPYAGACRSLGNPLKSFPCPSMPQDDSGRTTPQGDSMTKLCDDVASRIEARIKQQQRQSANDQSGSVVLSSSPAARGIVIVGEDTVGRYDLGIFVASIIPGGPAEKDGRIRAVPLSPNNLGNHHGPQSQQQQQQQQQQDPHSAEGSLDEIISDGSLSSLNSVRPEEVALELRKKGGILGIS
ncbi:hypothetical protein CRUP_006472, partial [Coryphaenoides rupestris]